MGGEGRPRASQGKTGSKLLKLDHSDFPSRHRLRLSAGIGGAERESCKTDKSRITSQRDPDQTTRRYWEASPP
ncbi:hypothetical protein E2C01_040746 [Portunus trituberculatus]|uniref:Uncharacterized protein n=1 Tax=Portunus trituberculatus TaxID=210409 RepID=A0A5B7FKL2_PORTR|nr:hypothetical protein [Portunus trituberculatus]